MVNLLEIAFDIPTDFTVETIWFLHDIYVSKYSQKQLWISLLVIVETEFTANHLLGHTNWIKAFKNAT